MNLSAVFPDQKSFVITIVYITLFVLQGILITASKRTDESGKSSYSYNPASAVLCTEMLKWIFAACLFIKDHSIGEYIGQMLGGSQIFMLYFVPAFMYTMYNNLSYVNLLHYDPTTYFLLLQIRVVVTGIVFQFLFNKQLSRTQWISLIVLTCGCVIKEYGHMAGVDAAKTKSAEELEAARNSNNFYLMLIFVQVFCSCFAGVYNEKLLKGSAGNVDIMVQNSFMYIDSILSNVCFMYVRGDLAGAISPTNIAALMEHNTMAIITNNALIGITTSLLLKHLNSIVKVYASAAELMITAVAAYFLFGITIDVYTVIAIGMVSYAIFSYTLNPVTNVSTPLPMARKRASDSDRE
eukprot:Nk52_evm55s270 gene=Nk52_evmTU55s270